MLHKTIN